MPMKMKKVMESELLNKDLFKMKSGLKDGELKTAEFLDELFKKAGKFILAKFLEEEVTDFLDREYYEHKEDANGYRNGYREKQLKLPNGEKIVIKIPTKRRDTENPFNSKILEAIEKGSSSLKE